MRDKEIGQFLLVLQFVHQVQHLSPDRYIQCGNGLIGNNQFGLHNQGPGNTDALTLSAGELMGIPGFMLRQQADFFQGAVHFVQAVLFVFIQVEIVQAFGNNVFNRRAFIQGRRRILEYHLDIPDHFRIFLFAELAGDPFALKGDYSVAELVDTHNGPSDGGFPAAGFTHQGKCFTPVDVKTRILNSLEIVLSAAVESYFHVFQRNKHLTISRFRHGKLLLWMSFWKSFHADS